jgi:hypothetical protein
MREERLVPGVSVYLNTLWLNILSPRSNTETSKAEWSNLDAEQTMYGKLNSIRKRNAQFPTTSLTTQPCRNSVVTPMYAETTEKTIYRLLQAQAL